jgi:proteasome beta subunit
VRDPGSPFPGGSPHGFGINPSFLDLVREATPEPRLPEGAVRSAEPPPGVPHGTTVLAFRFAEGVVMAGDRRAVEGFSIADERIEKVVPADDQSAVAIAGAAGQATEMVRLFQTELEHYEKVEGERLSLDGKANRLAQMIRQNFPMALQGLVVVPLFAGFDERRGVGRLYRYDVTGGRWEETDYHSTGSGSVHARGTLKKKWRAGLTRDEAIRLAVEALYDASQEDVATGGPNLLRGIFPSVKVITVAGVESVEEPEVRAAFEAVLEAAAGTESPRERGGSQAAEREGEGP